MALYLRTGSPAKTLRKKAVPKPAIIPGEKGLVLSRQQCCRGNSVVMATVLSCSVTVKVEVLLGNTRSVVR